MKLNDYQSYCDESVFDRVVLARFHFDTTIWCNRMQYSLHWDLINVSSTFWAAFNLVGQCGYSGYRSEHDAEWKSFCGFSVFASVLWFSESCECFMVTRRIDSRWFFFVSMFWEVLRMILRNAFEIYRKVIIADLRNFHTNTFFPYFKIIMNRCIVG